MRLPSRSAASLLAFAIVAACVPGPKAPDVSATRTLELQDELHTKASSRPFGVVSATPQGETSQASELAVVFNRPLRALETSDGEGPVPAQLEAVAGGTPKGHWQWMGTQAFLYVPDAELPAASQYRVTVPAGTRALDGSTLSAPYIFSFSTRRPVVALDETSRVRSLGPASTLRIRVNQPVDLREIERTTTLVNQSKKGSIAMRASYAAAPKTTPASVAMLGQPTPTLTDTIVLTPVTPLPLASDFVVRVSAGLRGKEGPLPMLADASFAVSTYGPLQVKSISCGGDERCSPSGGVHVELSNRVAYKDLRAAITANGKAMPKGDEESDRELTSDFWVPGPLPPGGTVTVSVRPGLRDEFGQILGAGRSNTLRVGDLPSRIEVGVEGHVFERKLAGSARSIGVRTVNVDEYDLSVVSLNEEQAVRFAFAESRGSVESWQLLDGLGTEPRRIRPQAGRNRAALENVSLDAALGKPNGAGVVVLGTSAAFGETTARYTQRSAEAYRVTDLAISAKVSRYGGVMWVTRLSDAQPAAGAAVRVRSADTGAVLFQGTTDAAGLVDVPSGLLFQDNGPQAGLAVAVAALGDDWTYRALDYPNNTGVYPDPARELSTVAMLFTDRGLYRRGESVHVKTLFRQEQLTGLQNPAGRPIKLTATDASGTVVFERGAQLGAFGEAAFEIPVGESAPLGALSLRAVLTEHEEAGAAYDSVQVAAYRPAEFKTAASFAKPTHVRGDKASCSARGEYLFGAPLNQGTARFTLSRRATWFSPPGQDERIVDDGAFGSDAHASSPAYSLISSGGQSAPGDAGDKPLDARGEARHDFTLVLPEQRGAESVTCEADLTDVSRQSIAAETTTLVHPGTFYVVLDAPDERFLTESATLAPKVRTIGPEGHVRIGVAVKLELFKRTWSSVYEETGDSGGHYSTQVKDVLVKACDTKSVAGAASCPLAVDGPGYYVVHATATDERKNPLGASYGVYVSGESGGAGWPQRDDASLDLELDRTSYEVGQTAKLLVKNPFLEADALVTVERASTLQRFRVHVKGPAPVLPIPIGADIRPNAYVTVELVRGRVREEGLPPAPAKPGVITKRTRTQSPKAVDLGGPAYRIGTVPIAVSPASRRLKVAVKSPKTQYGPGEQLDVDVDVKDVAGKGTEADVTFYVVDEGVLMLSGYKTPDPVPTFTQGLPLRVASYETRAELARLLKFRGQLGADKGLEGGGGGDGVRADFRTTAVFTSLKTDAQGHAHVRTKLPEGLTTYRVMAVVAGRDDRFGFGESRVTTSRPLMVRPALPRFLRAGDAIDAGAIITAKGLPAGAVHVSVSATGVAIEGGAEQTVNLPKDGSAEVRFKLRADRVGPATFTFRAEGMGAKDAAVFTKKVQIPSIYETVALSGETEKAVAEKLGDLSAIRSDSGGLSVRLASTALVGVESVVDQLTEYPHGCTEQLASRLLPLLESKELAGFFGIQVANKPEKLADAAIAQILERQHSDGGFAYWPTSPDSDPWLSTYATMVLGRASAAGRPVPPPTMVRAVQYLRRWLEAVQSPGRSYASGSWAQRAFVVDVLATLGEPTDAAPRVRKKGAPAAEDTAAAGLAGAIHALLPVPADAPLFARALLTHAVAMAKLRKEDQLELARDLEQYVRLTPTGAVAVERGGAIDREMRQRLLDSDLRTTAMVLRALVAVDPVHPLAPKLAKGLLASRRNGSYQSTQEAAWALLGLDDYRKAYEKAPPAFDARLFLGGTLAHEAGFRGGTARAQTTDFSMDKLFGGDVGSAPMAFEVVGSGTLFYEARLRYARKVNPTTSLARGFTVQKWMRAVKPETLAAATATFPKQSDAIVDAGSLVLVDLVVVNDLPQYQVVLDDPLPAGLEAINGALVGASQSLSDAMANAQSREENDEDGEYRYRRSANYERKLDDDRVLTYVEDLPAGLHHYRYLARATTRGRFIVPPARVECMYEPEVFGRTPGLTFTVK